MKRSREGIGTVSEADFSLCSGLLKEKSNEADGSEIECDVLIYFGVVPKSRYFDSIPWAPGYQAGRTLLSCSKIARVAFGTCFRFTMTV